MRFIPLYFEQTHLTAHSAFVVKLPALNTRVEVEYIAC